MCNMQFLHINLLLLLFQDDYLLKKEMYGNLSGLTDEEFNMFYTTTGLKLDNRHEMMEGMTKHMEYAVTKFVQYAKVIPGFSSLPIEDQANLIKSKMIYLKHLYGENKHYYGEPFSHLMVKKTEENLTV